MNKDIIKLTDDEIYGLQKQHTPLVFKNECHLIYESHIPHAGILLLQGELKLIRKRKILGTLPFGSMIGLGNLIHNTPLPLGVKVSKDSRVILIEKSQILQEISQRDGIIYRLISPFL